MRKLICLYLVLALFLCGLAGCGQEEPTKKDTLSTQVPASGQSTMETSGTNGQSDEPSATNPLVTDPSIPAVAIPPTAPANPSNTIVPFDPDREIYLVYGQQRFTVYSDYSTTRYFTMYIYSRQPLDTAAISLSVFAETTYTVRVGEMSLGGIPDEEQTEAVTTSQFPYALYQCYMGKDFARLWELEQTMNEAAEAADQATKNFMSDKISAEEYKAIADASVAATQAYERYRDAEKASYYLLTQADLPQFYVYAVVVDFRGKSMEGGQFVDETITQAGLRIGDQTHMLDLGEIRLARSGPDFPAELDWYDADYATDGILGDGNTPYLYNDGLHRIEAYFTFDVKHAMSLTDLVLYDPNQTVEAVWLDVAYASGGSDYLLWNRSEPFLLLPGDRVRIHIAYRDEAATTLNYTTKVWGSLIYDWEGGTACKLSECTVRSAKGLNLYEMYALIFDGLDMESYYRDYYYPKYESWREELN